MGTRWLSTCGLVSVLVLSVSAVRSSGMRTVVPSLPSIDHPAPERAHSITMVALGDVNLGRQVGQEILGGDTLYPFKGIMDSLGRFDLVFANLESQLSDQHGETQSPRNNLIFTGPPGGAWSLRGAGITIVSTANNHALDYGVRALGETIANLDSAKILHVGTSLDSASLYRPMVVIRDGLTIAFFACTGIMNIENPMWKRFVAEADTSRILPAIRSIRDSVDFVVVSFHGGEEYADSPSPGTKEFAMHVLEGGADLFLGHHPHVPYGIDEVNGRYIVYSLGNFVFRQPDRYWTQHSFAFSATLTKDAAGTRITATNCLPIEAGLQPRFVTDPRERQLILERIGALSNNYLALTGSSQSY
jgi:poly-gamma-glutamate capsule biosynthesis protein CapA/YwtB (metallophosphatase superfamily)